MGGGAPLIVPGRSAPVTPRLDHAPAHPSGGSGAERDEVPRATKVACDTSQLEQEESGEKTEVGLRGSLGARPGRAFSAACRQSSGRAGGSFLFATSPAPRPSHTSRIVSSPRTALARVPPSWVMRCQRAASSILAPPTALNPTWDLRNRVGPCGAASHLLPPPRPTRWGTGLCRSLLDTV